jgi:hypothetical protein
MAKTQMTSADRTECANYSDHGWRTALVKWFVPSFTDSTQLSLTSGVMEMFS